jgi:hypothetical protein
MTKEIQEPDQVDTYAKEPIPMEKLRYVFNPDADYSWKADDYLSFRGKEFEVVHNTLSSIFSQNVPPAQMYLLLYDAFQVTSLILKRNVEEGNIKEVEKSANLGT